MLRELIGSRRREACGRRRHTKTCWEFSAAESESFWIFFYFAERVNFNLGAFLTDSAAGHGIASPAFFMFATAEAAPLRVFEAAVEDASIESDEISLTDLALAHRARTGVSLQKGGARAWPYAVVLRLSLQRSFSLATQTCFPSEDRYQGFLPTPNITPVPDSLASPRWTPARDTPQGFL